MTYAPDRYETDSGELVGRSLEEAVEWARANPEAFSRTNVWWVRDDDCEATIVDRDIRDELAYATGEWFGAGDAKELTQKSRSTHSMTEPA